jgi:cytochrome P450/NADPH-cytochrome P450 reductase
VTTKPVAVPVVRVARDLRDSALALRDRPAAPMPLPAAASGWGAPTEIPATSAYRELVIAYGSNFGANKELAERFAERSRYYGFSTEVLTLNELAEAPPHSEPWLLVALSSTYTSNPPSNAAAFKAALESTVPGAETWRNCRYLVWGTGNSQWNAFLAFPRYLYAKLEEVGATPLADFAFGDVGSPLWEQVHAEWNDRVWSVLKGLAGARESEAAAARLEAEQAAAHELTDVASNTAMAKSLAEAAPRVLLAPTILTNAVGAETVEARAAVCRELQADGSEKRTRHLELTLPEGFVYRAGDHLGVCPRNAEERVERLARHLGAELDGLFMVPQSVNVRVVPKGVVLQVRNVLTNLVDICGLPTLPLLELLIAKATDAEDRSGLERIVRVLDSAGEGDSGLRATIETGGYDVIKLLDEFPSASINIFEFMQVAQPLRPRYYSTSSSPQVHGDGVAHIAVGLGEFRGMSAGYLHSLREGDRVPVFLDRSEGFHLQDDLSKPMIFVSAGTGFAPMRAFLWERLALKRSGTPLSEAVLFNGIRSTAMDYIYRDEIEWFLSEGVLNDVQVCTSREDPARREYVQDRLRAHGDRVWRMLEEGAYVYVCGAQQMRDGVRAAFVDLIAEHASLPHERAESILLELETVDNRYRPDLWG